MSDRILFVDNEGQLFYIEPPEDKFISIVERNLRRNSFDKRVLRVSNCDWCFWSIDSDFEIQLYVYNREFPLQVVEQTFENQRRYPLLYKNEFTNKLLKSDPPIFSSSDGKLDLPKESFYLPSIESWCWAGDWTISLEKQTINDNGWMYGSSFDRPFKATKSWYDNVRRRKWTRRRFFTNYESFIQVDMPFSCEFANDISIGGWSISGIKKGFLCVWMTSNSGKLYFRENVSYENPEGTHWTEVQLPNDYRALSISCNENGHLWLVTVNCHILLRKNVNSNAPMGTDWQIINSINKEYSFSKISCNSKLVYALDHNGDVYLRKGISENSEEGSEWIKVLKGLSSISVSQSNKLWGLGVDKRTIYIGTKVENMESKLFKWTSVFSEVDLDYLDASSSIDQLDD